MGERVVGLLVAMIIATGCLPTYQTCCIVDDPSGSAIGVGRLATCECPAGAICDSIGHVACTDDASRCVTATALTLGSDRGWGENVECAGDAPTWEVEVCVDEDGDGAGTIVVTRCPATDDDCGWHIIGRGANRCGGDDCATVADDGISWGCGGRPVDAGMGLRDVR